MIDLDMSPYGAFVWPAWIVSAVVLGGLVARAVAASRRWRGELKRLEAAEDDRPQAAMGPQDRPQAAQGPIGPQE